MKRLIERTHLKELALNLRFFQPELAHFPIFKEKNVSS